MLKLRTLFLVLLFSLNLFAVDVIVVESKIDYNEKIDKNKLKTATVLEVRKFCIPLTLKDIETNVYVAKRYLKEGTVLCTKDVELHSKETILFDFGTIQIEKEGKIIFENDEYIRIKRPDGKIEKFYKDGRLQ